MKIKKANLISNLNTISLPLSHTQCGPVYLLQYAPSYPFSSFSNIAISVAINQLYAI